MLFNSYEFIFIYFPVAFLGFFVIGRHSAAGAAAWLGLASLVFYGWWSVAALPLLLGSILFNYLAGVRLSALAAAPGRSRSRKIHLWAALAVNLALLGFFKYADFFIGNINEVLAAAGLRQWDLLHIVLPIGISFFTFTQIAFLVDCWQGKVRETNFVHYLLFVTYFPHLIAGPVLHHSQMMPQFAQAETYRPNPVKITTGIAIFTIGLAKKLLIADPLAAYASLLFDGVSRGVVPELLFSWFGVLAYTFQIYFDFSGYTDMAIGLSLMLGIVLPVNFNSPYKAISIVDFWRRWHITLSNFLRDYLYIPLGGNRFGRVRRYMNLVVTMVLGGLWHGANWTFVMWGALHGAYLMINHAWHAFFGDRAYGIAARASFHAVTFLAACFSWVLFRADSIDSAATIYRGLLGLQGMVLPESMSRMAGGLLAGTARFGDVWQSLLVAEHTTADFLTLLGIAAVVAFGFGNTNALRDGHWPARSAAMTSCAAGAFCGLLLFVALSMLHKPSPFLYFQF